MRLLFRSVRMRTQVKTQGRAAHARGRRRALFLSPLSRVFFYMYVHVTKVLRRRARGKSKCGLDCFFGELYPVASLMAVGFPLPGLEKDEPMDFNKC